MFILVLLCLLNHPAYAEEFTLSDYSSLELDLLHFISGSVFFAIPIGIFFFWFKNFMAETTASHSQKPSR